MNLIRHPVSIFISKYLIYNVNSPLIFPSNFVQLAAGFQTGTAISDRRRTIQTAALWRRHRHVSRRLLIHFKAEPCTISSPDAASGRAVIYSRRVSVPCRLPPPPKTGDSHNTNLPNNLYRAASNGRPLPRFDLFAFPSRFGTAFLWPPFSFGPLFF